MAHYDKLSRLASLLLAAGVATLTVMIAVPGIRAATTVPNAATFTYNLAAGASSAPITPPTNRPTLVMGVCNTLGTRGVGFVTLLHVPGFFLEWVGLNSTASGTIAQGFSGTAGTKIVQIDFTGGAVIQVNSPDTFVVHNTLSSGSRDGNVTLMW